MKVIGEPAVLKEFIVFTTGVLQRVRKDRQSVPGPRLHDRGGNPSDRIRAPSRIEFDIPVWISHDLA